MRVREEKGVVNSPLGRNDERVLLPHNLTLGNRLFRDEPFPFSPIEILDLDGRRPFSDIEAFDEC